MSSRSAADEAEEARLQRALDKSAGKPPTSPRKYGAAAAAPNEEAAPAPTARRQAFQNRQYIGAAPRALFFFASSHARLQRARVRWDSSCAKPALRGLDRTWKRRSALKI